MLTRKLKSILKILPNRTTIYSSKENVQRFMSEPTKDLSTMMHGNLMHTMREVTSVVAVVFSSLLELNKLDAPVQAKELCSLLSEMVFKLLFLPP